MSLDSHRSQGDGFSPSHRGSARWIQSGTGVLDYVSVCPHVVSTVHWRRALGNGLTTVAVCCGFTALYHSCNPVVLEQHLPVGHLDALFLSVHLRFGTLLAVV
ncbi:hypothetical protein MHYP_G00311590 [Metynnis hypsauchen]